MVNIKEEKASRGLEEYTQEFLEDRIAEYSQMKELFLQSNFIEIKAIAHKWKGFCSPYGFNHLETLSQQLEETIHSDNLQRVSAIMKDISEYLEAKANLLKQKE